MSSWSSNNTRMNTRQVAIATVATTSTLVVAGALSWAFRSVSKYGWKGTFNLVWEGDPYYSIRERLDELNSVQEALVTQNATLSSIEEGLSRAKLDTIDEASSSLIIELWQAINCTEIGSLQTQVAWLSDQLDKLAARVDQVPVTGTDTTKPKTALASLSSLFATTINQHDQLRKQKRELSQQIVAMMDRADSLMEFYKLAAEKS